MHVQTDRISIYNAKKKSQFDYKRETDYFVSNTSTENFVNNIYRQWKQFKSAEQQRFIAIIDRRDEMQFSADTNSIYKIDKAQKNWEDKLYLIIPKK